MKEVDFQGQIVKSIAKSGGYAKKWASDWQAGNPDLVCHLPDFGTFFAEVKLLKDLKLGQRFKRKVGLTKLQHKELLDMNKVGALAVVMTVLYYSPQKVLLTVQDPLHLSELGDTWVDDEGGPLKIVVPRATGKFFDVRSLMNEYLGKRSENL